MITNGVQEASTHSASLGGSGGIRAGEGRYPFVEPSTVAERAWWDEMRRVARDGGPTTRAEMADRLKRWYPLLRAMTPAERQEFHGERLTAAAGFTWDLDSVRGEGERDPAEEHLFAKWTQRLTRRTP